MRLNNTIIKNAKTNDKPIKLFDGQGLHLQVMKNGSKWWRFKYHFAGKEKLLSLGVYPDVSLKKARDRRYEMRQLLVDGIDPSQHRKSMKAAGILNQHNSFEVVAREWFNKYSTHWSTSYCKNTLGRLERNLFPWIGSIPIAELTALQILSTIRRMEERGILESAHRSLRTCGQVFRYAVATGRAERDICADLRGALPPVKSKHFAAVVEPEQARELLRAIDQYQGTFVVQCALKLAPLVFVRPGELRSAKWADIDLKKSEWRYLVSKTKTEHVVPLSTQAVTILQALQPLTGRSAYIFPSARSSQRPMSDNAILVALRSLGIEKETMTGHGFRAMARTMLDEVLGFRPDFIEHQLAHAVRDPNGRAYNRTAHLVERKKMMQRWADYLDELKSH